MSKNYVDVVGIKKGIIPEVVATFSNRPLANWHVKNTLDALGYDDLLLRNSKRKGDKFVNDTVAEDKGLYVKTEATMSVTDLGTVTSKNTFGTLLGFILGGNIASKAGLNKLEVSDAEGNEDDITLTITTVYEETESTNLDRISKRLSKELIEQLTGGSAGEEADEEEEVEEEKPKPTKKEKPKDEEVEEVIEEEDVEEDEDDEEVEEVIEDEDEELEDEEEDTEELEEVDEDEIEEEVDEDDIDEEDILDEDDFEELEDIDL